MWSHQEELLDYYHADHLNTANVALELPTGSGKTLVGLLIAEFRRRSYQERVVYLCPTRQLCSQVHRQSKGYGIPSSLLIGRQTDYDLNDFVAYQRAETIAITTYSGLFNTNPRIDDPEVVICDDAHAADQHIASLWSMKISREENEQLFEGVVSLLAPAITEDMRRRINSGGPWDGSWVDLIPIPKYLNCIEDLADTLEAHVGDTNLQHPWKILQGHLDACNIYLAPDSILIRPLIAPTSTHMPFSRARQRVFMSATLGKGGEIERSTGVKIIDRLPIPRGWDTRGIGRRLILFLDLLQSEEEVEKVIDRLVLDGPRTLALVKDNRTLEHLKKHYKDDVNVFTALDIETSIEVFLESEKPAMLLLANRYDGLDLSGDTCRSMLLFGLPAATDLQERFFLERLGARAQLRDRIRTRITQGFGRCSRDEYDYALILAVGSDLLKWCCTASNIEGMHSELQAEISFGLENSRGRTVEEFEELFNAFMDQDEDWEAANQDILQRRNSIECHEDDVVSALAKSAKHEIESVYAAWQQDYERAYICAVKATEALAGGHDLKPYRAYWHLSASTAAFEQSIAHRKETWRHRFEDHVRRAKACTYSLRWLSSLADVVGGEGAAGGELSVQIEEVERLLEEWHLTGPHFERSLATARECITADEAKKFDRGLKQVGRMLGCEAKAWSPDTEGAPDGLWNLVSGTSIVFECKSNSKPDHPVELSSIRQAATHEEWLKSQGEIGETTKVITVLVTPRTTIRSGGRACSADLRVVQPDLIRRFFNIAADLLNTLRIEARGISEEQLSELIARSYRQKGLTHDQICRQLSMDRLKDLPE